MVPAPYRPPVEIELRTSFIDQYCTKMAIDKNPFLLLLTFTKLLKCFSYRQVFKSQFSLKTIKASPQFIIHFSQKNNIPKNFHYFLVCVFGLLLFLDFNTCYYNNKINVLLNTALRGAITNDRDATKMSVVHHTNGESSINLLLFSICNAFKPTLCSQLVKFNI